MRIGGERMVISWTDEQKKAIDKDGCNLIVAAAAGSGKTAVLVEKIVNIIESGTDIDSLLITTFTEAAAKKMRQEICDEIKRRLVNDRKNSHLARQLVLIGRADICTIDSFCMKIVRSNFHLLDIEPDFKIADPNEAELLRTQVTEELFGELYEQNDDDFYNLLEAYASQRGDDALMEIVLSFHSFVRTIPNYEQWLLDCADMYNSFGENIFDTIWGKIILQSTQTKIDGYIMSVRDALDYARQTEQMNSYVVPLEIDLRELTEIKSILKDASFDEIAHRINSFSLATGGRAKNKTPDEIKEPLISKRKYAADGMKNLAAEFFYDDEEGIKKEIEYTSSQVKTLCNVVCMLEKRFFEMKNKRGILDFSDLEHLTLKVLTKTDDNGNTAPSAVALELKNKYKMILIDEYQDSNELQETIFSRIAREDNIFMVGDLKQSIYRFRHTNPLLFKNKKDTYSDDSGINQRVIMSKNFRSRKPVIDFVNFVMSQAASPLVGEMEYDDTESLCYEASYPDDVACDKAVEVHIIDDGDRKDTESDNDDSIFGAEAEAVCVAKRILQLKRDGFEVYDKKEGMRPLQYKDIVILMRSPSVDAQIFSDVLTSYGIPTFSDVGGGYFNTDEIELMLSTLSVVDNPQQDINLLALMRSPIGNFNDVELMDIRLCDTKSDIYSALCACAEESTMLGVKCAAFIARINDWRKKALYMSVHEFIQYLYSDTGYFDIAGAGDLGTQRQANLNLLLEYARSYEKTSFKGLFNFISYVERVKGSRNDFGSAKILGENQDVVRIMSIHKSKGLEFGVVFVTRLAKKFNTRDLSNSLLMHGEFGLGVDYIDIDNRYKFSTLIKRAIKEKLRYELLSEEIRVLYVALTRARDKLILTLAPTDVDAKKKRWISGAKSLDNEHLPLYYTSSAQGIGDWIMGALMRHKACRNYAGEYISCAENEAQIELYVERERLCSPSDTYEKLSIKPSNNNYTALVEEKLGYKYPYENARKVPTKISVTEMKRLVDNELDTEQMRLCGEHMISMPNFLSQKTQMSAAQKGSALHFVMQNLDLSKMLDENGIREQIESMLLGKVITKEYAEVANAKKIADFFDSELGRRMVASKNVVRESPFEIAIDASKIIGDSACGEQVLLQGIIDCYFYENDEIVLVDYKTDFVRNEDDIAKIKQRYEVQLELYAYALEQITNKRVKEKNLYLFSSKSVIQY